jgi:hypothetical protein
MRHYILWKKCKDVLEEQSNKTRNQQAGIFAPFDGGSIFFQHVSDFYQTTQHNIPDDRALITTIIANSL